MPLSEHRLGVTRRQSPRRVITAGVAFTVNSGAITRFRYGVISRDSAAFQLPKRNNAQPGQSAGCNVKVRAGFILLWLFAIPAAAECTLNPANLRAQYQIIQQQPGAEKKHTLVLWRSNNQSLHQRPDQGISDHWRWLRDGEIAHIRFFEHFDRGVALPTVTTDWSAKYQLLSDNALQQMTLEERSGSGCQRLEKYRRQLRDGTLIVWWNPDLELVVLLDRQMSDSTTTMKLVDFDTDDELVKTEISRRLSLPVTELDTVKQNAEFAQAVLQSL